MSQISIWPLRKTWLSTWWKNPYRPLQRSDVSCSWPHISGGILSHSSLQILSESLRFRVWQLATRTFHSLDRLSMGLRSGDWLDHSRTLCFFLSHSFVALAVCFGSLSCWNTHPRPLLNALALTVHGPAHRPFDVVQLSCPFSRKAPPKQWWGWCSWGHRQHSPSSKHGELSWCQRAKFLVSIIGKLQTGLYMCFFEQGDLAGAARFQSFTA